MKLTL